MPPSLQMSQRSVIISIPGIGSLFFASPESSSLDSFLSIGGGAGMKGVFSNSSSSVSSHIFSIRASPARSKSPPPFLPRTYNPMPRTEIIAIKSILVFVLVFSPETDSESPDASLPSSTGGVVVQGDELPSTQTVTFELLSPPSLFPLVLPVPFEFSPVLVSSSGRTTLTPVRSPSASIGMS